MRTEAEKSNSAVSATVCSAMTLQFLVCFRISAAQLPTKLGGEITRLRSLVPAINANADTITS